MDTKTPICSQCGQSLPNNKSNRKQISLLPLQNSFVGAFASGASNTSITPYKLHKKPIIPLTPSHFFFAGFVGFAGTAIIGTMAGIVCELGTYCLDLQTTILVAAIGGVGVAIGTLRFIDQGRYEIKEEVTPQTVASSAPKSKATADPVVHRIEFKTVNHNGRVNIKWFELPKGITDENIKAVGTALQASDWKYSRPLLCDTYKAISQYKYHKLTAILKEKGMVISEDRNNSYVNGAGRAFFRDFMVENTA